MCGWVQCGVVKLNAWKEQKEKFYTCNNILLYCSNRTHELFENIAADTTFKLYNILPTHTTYLVAIGVHGSRTTVQREHLQ